ncbi:MAG: YggS family pyridoxal phosphate-dependent enzyme [Candidatus Omnitrophica bacterium]|jgi:hypothetical protein|nr:YggS family pyridoxal phosphate-dependent enzyme [Candidatus Omnitrophota bacterium]
MLGDNILKVKDRIASVCAKNKLKSEEIILICVTKNRRPEDIEEAIAAGITDIGENRVQEALSKYNQLSAFSCQLSAVRWHLVGHLQTNKVKDAVHIFDLIHSVDSLRLAQEIDKQASRINKIQDILLEVKTSPEATKFGLKPDEVIEVIKEIAKLKNINLLGLMTIAPIVDNPQKSRPYFRQLRELRDKICNDFGFRISNLGFLSMGMTDDFEIALEEGANMIRLGRAIFGG